MKTEELEVAVPNTAASAVGPGALLEAGTEVGVVLDVSTATRLTPGAVLATTAEAGRLGAGDVASSLASGAPGAVGAASEGGPAGLALAVARVGLLAAGCRAGSFFAGSEACRGAWEGACGCTGSVTVDAEPSLLPGFSGVASDVASSVLFPEATGKEGVGAELRRPLKDMVGNDAARGVAVVTPGGVGASAVSLVCWIPNEKTVLLPLSDVPLKPRVPVLASGRLPKTPAEELAMLVLVVASGAAGLAVTVEVARDSAGFPSTGELLKLNPEAMLKVLAGCAPTRLGEGDLLGGFAESSTGPTRRPEKLPRVSPAKELGNKSSPSLLGGVSSLLAAVGSVTPGLLLEGRGSPGEVAVVPPGVLGDAASPEGVALSGTGS